MTTEMVRQTAFSTGEVDVVTWKRTDVEVYMTAAQSLLNVEVGTTGLARKRKGTQMMLDVSTQATLRSRMYDFIDKLDRHYILLSADQKFYVYQVLPGTSHVVTHTPANVLDGNGNQVVAYSNGLTPFGSAITSPYLLSELSELDYTQDNDSIIFTHPNHPPGRVYISDYGTLTFAYEELIIYPLPAYDFGKVTYNAASVTRFDIDPTINELGITISGLPVSPAPIFTTDWIGGQIIGAGASDIDPIGVAIITGVGNPSPGVVTMLAKIQVPFKAQTAPIPASQFSIRQPAWSGSSTAASFGYPAKVLYFQNRLWFGGTNSLPATVFGSKINSPLNFDVGVGRDTEAIVYTIGQTNSGKICWLNGGKQLEIFTDNYEFACPQDTNSALTPSSFTIRQQSSYGCSKLLKPLTYINDSYYATKTGKALSNYHFTGVGLAYSSANISVASSHLVKNPTNRALVRGSDTSQDNFIYFLNSDNTITTFQFAAELKLAALTPMTTEENVSLIDIVTSENNVYILKRYDLTNTYTLEKMVPDVKMDSYRKGSMDATGLITGLTTLAGYTAQVLYTGQDYGTAVVKSDGTLKINNTQKIADTVQIGLLYDVKITPMYLFAGPTASPFFKQITQIYVDYEDSLNFKINGKLVPYQTYDDIQKGLPLTPRSGTAIISPVRGWNRFDTFSIEQSSPFDLQITAIAYQVSVAKV